MRNAAPIARDLVLVGGGHAHVHVLKQFGMRPEPGLRVTLVTRDSETPYSGMLPGYVAGQYSFADCHIDLRRLARFAGARLVHDEASGLDRAQRRVLCRAHPPIRYDILSLDIGSAPGTDEVPGAAEHTVPVKPIADFARRWEGLLERARDRPGLRLVIVGGGAGGVELALAAHHRLARLSGGRPSVALVTRDGLLPSHNRGIRRRFRRLFEKRGIAILPDSEIVRVEPGLLIAADGTRIDFDEALWVTEAGAAPWLATTGLALDEGGFVAVGATWRSIADACVFAAGDVSAMVNHPREKAGVYAVRAGPPLAENLRRALTGRRLRRGVPQRRGLALIGTADGRAVASRGLLSAEGAWLWRLKRWIDRRWIDRYRNLPLMQPGPGEEPMRCGGCAAKVPAAVLGRVLAGLPAAAGGAVELGLSGPDDAALVTLPGAPPLLQTVDFFRAMVDDPYLFGRIAANHALGDIYAMGGVPDTALAIATVPPARPEIVEHDLSHMLRGGIAMLEQAGAVLVGGHSAEGAELALGFAITGRKLPGRILRKGGLRAGDRLILTKPLGTGVILAADMRGSAPAAVVEAALATMLQPTADAASCLIAHSATACTDVTGFGLLGHLLEMLRASQADATLDPDAVPALPGALALLRSGIASSLHADNQAATAALDPGGTTPERVALLIDPQTAGGLLAGVPLEHVAACLEVLRRDGYAAAEIGGVERCQGEAPRVRLVPGHRSVSRREPVPTS